MKNDIENKLDNNPSFELKRINYINDKNIIIMGIVD